MASRSAPKGKPQPQQQASNKPAPKQPAAGQKDAQGKPQQSPKQGQGKKTTSNNDVAPGQKQQQQQQQVPKSPADKPAVPEQVAETKKGASTSTTNTSPRSGEEKGERVRGDREKKPKKEKESGKGTVRSVLAGDRLVIYSEDGAKKAVWSPPSEREIKLSSIKAPKPYAKGDWGERPEEVLTSPFPAFFLFSPPRLSSGCLELWVNAGHSEIRLA